MDNAFFKAFNASNRAAEKVMGEPWTLVATPAVTAQGVEYPSIAIEKLTVAQRAVLGGNFKDVSTTIEIRRAIAKESGVKKDSFIRARGEVFRVIEFEYDGDDAVTMMCGPVGAAMPRR